jgi:uncharacterized protein YxeA
MIQERSDRNVLTLIMKIIIIIIIIIIITIIMSSPLSQAQDIDWRRALVNTVMKLRVPKDVGKFSNS